MVNQLVVGFVLALCNSSDLKQCSGSAFSSVLFSRVLQIAGFKVTYIPIPYRVYSTSRLIDLLNDSRINVCMHEWPLSPLFDDSHDLKFTNLVKLQEYSFLFKRKLVLDSKFWFILPFSRWVWLAVVLIYVTVTLAYNVIGTVHKGHGKAKLNFYLPVVGQTLEPMKLRMKQKLTLIFWYFGAFIMANFYTSNILSIIINSMGFKGLYSMVSALELINRGEYKFVTPNYVANDKEREMLATFTVADMPDRWHMKWKRVVKNKDSTKLLPQLSTYDFENFEQRFSRYLELNDGFTIRESFGLRARPTFTSHYAYTAVQPRAYLFSIRGNRSKINYDRFNEAMMLTYFYGLDDKLFKFISAQQANMNGKSNADSKQAERHPKIRYQKLVGLLIMCAILLGSAITVMLSEACWHLRHGSKYHLTRVSSMADR